MKDALHDIYRNQSLIYKTFLFLCATALVIYLFPKAGKFKYEFQKGKAWQYENLYAPFDFAIQKTEKEIADEQEEVRANFIPYYAYDTSVVSGVTDRYEAEYANYFKRRGPKKAGQDFLEMLYADGVVADTETLPDTRFVNVVKGNEVTPVAKDKLVQIGKIRQLLSDFLAQQRLSDYEDDFYDLFTAIVKPNIIANKELSEKALEDELNNIYTTKGTIDRGKRIILNGEVVEGEKYEILTSLKKEYESHLWKGTNYYWIVFGYTILVALAFVMLLLFLRKYRPHILQDNTKVTFIFVNIIAMVFITTIAVKYDGAYVYVVPLCILPIILKAFFDARLGLFVHVLTVLLLGFIVPNSFEYVFLQVIAGIVTILTVSELYRRANLFVSVGQITLVYMITYFAFTVIHEGNLQNIIWLNFGLFILNGLATLFAQPLIYIYEKLFGLVSDVSLLELSDTNSRLLKELSDKAPGTFHHSLQVANLAEAAANEVGANAMLVRVGALYHDIGKMNNATYFTENQTTSVNPHDEINPAESAQIIIRHVLDGIELARKNNLPDRVIDFIRTHHGTSTVYYFYKKQLENDENTPVEDYKYPGPIPFSKETAIVMMSDAVEAASKSLKNPNYGIINDFVEKIVNKQIEEGQFLNANITFKEIESVKKVLKQKLTNIYHLRVEYPE
ncbi:HD family phosphohydrolase [Sinomicrobium weinanense]|uniref:HDIG domain-containing protein n=1 Tax=Sinomicrobium weinanense TaxID=2842200 RepID=A0A926JQ65_9FLAO|nr:HDIG domain-containing metalloprotein [Sinomicrobium weinanense]MBC9795349.1 HDIG domain-containing protein [Sinomicrobium weinanense]MBU3122936.1 HDIG domain-containing protein [Sinomicrobium weinanense]